METETRETYKLSELIETAIHIYPQLKQSFFQIFVEDAVEVTGCCAIGFARIGLGIKQKKAKNNYLNNPSLIPFIHEAGEAAYITPMDEKDVKDFMGSTAPIANNDVSNVIVKLALINDREKIPIQDIVKRLKDHNL